MSQAVVRTIFRWIHIVCGIPILGYIYDSPTDTPNYAWAIRDVFLPALLISGLWMWRAISFDGFFRKGRRPAQFCTRSREASHCGVCRLR